MKVTSPDFAHGAYIPPAFAMGRRGEDGEVGFGENRCPTLCWEPVAGAQSYAILCCDVDAPLTLAPSIPIDAPRGPFYHWAVINIPKEILLFSSKTEGVIKRGKPAVTRTDGVREGVNDYTSWFKGNPDMEGIYTGYDGPFPPPQDAKAHAYHFQVYALTVPSLSLQSHFTAGDMLEAMAGHVCDQGVMVGHYTLYKA